MTSDVFQIGHMWKSDFRMAHAEIANEIKFNQEIYNRTHLESYSFVKMTYNKTDISMQSWLGKSS